MVVDWSPRFLPIFRPRPALARRRRWWCSCLAGMEVRGGDWCAVLDVVWASLCFEGQRCRCWSRMWCSVDDGGGAVRWKRMAQVDQLTGGVRATVPSEGLLLPWPEPAATAPVGDVSFLKALSWYYACLHRVQAPGGNLRFGSPIRQCWRGDLELVLLPSRTGCEELTV